MVGWICLTGHSHDLLMSAIYIIPYMDDEVAFPSTLTREQWLIPKLVNKRALQCYTRLGGKRYLFD